MCDAIKIDLKRRIATRSGNGNQPPNNKTAANYKARIIKFRWSFYFILFLLFIRIFMTSHMTLSSASFVVLVYLRRGYDTKRIVMVGKALPCQISLKRVL